MDYSHYTHDLLIKNHSEVQRNCSIELESGPKKRLKKLVKSGISKKPKPTIALPGLINLHTHLAYSTLKIKPQSLFPWLKDLVKRIYKINHLGEGFTLNFDAESSYLEGLKESLGFGTTYIVDNTSHPELALRAFQALGMQGLIGVEIFGSDPNLADEIFDRSTKQIKKLETETNNENIEFALSPHASYDVSPELWRKCLEWSSANHRLLLSHLSESSAEEAWFRDKDSTEANAAKDFWDDLGTLEPKIKNWQSYRSATAFLHQNKMFARNMLLTHLCYADDEDLAVIKEYGVSLVSCPRSNAYLNNKPADIDQWLEKQLPFGIGTDSKASNYSLDLRAEVNQLKHLSAQKRFELLTLDAAKALGKENLLGSLDEGNQADWIVLEVLNDNINLETIDPFALTLDTKLTRVQKVYIAGELKYTIDS